MSTTLYQFTGDALGPIEWCDPVRGSVLVADSWRVEEGEAVGLNRHRERFLRSVREHSAIEQASLDTFWSAMVAELPRHGSWFPRVELVSTPGGPTLRYRQRPAPEWSKSVVLALTSNDPRTTPLTKGPDLEALLAVRQSVASSGATEALITASDGTLVEGAYSSLLVWAEDHLVAIPAEFPRIPSVTEAIIREIAVARAISVAEQTLVREDLEDREVWIVSALHGIRLVESIVGGPTLKTVPGRRDRWQDLWWDSREPLA